MNYEYINTIPFPLLPEINETYPNDEMLEMARNQSIPSGEESKCVQNKCLPYKS